MNTTTPGPRGSNGTRDDALATSPSAFERASAQRPLLHRVLEELLPNLAVLVTLVAPLLVWNRLPDPIASHWGTGGQPDGSLPLIAEVTVLCLATAAVAYGPVVAARFPMPRAQARLLVSAAGFASVLLAGVRIASVRANVDVARWQEAGSLSGWTVLAAAGAGVLAGLIGWWAAGSRPDLPPPSTQHPDPVAVEPGERVVWVGAASGRLPVAVATGLLVVAALGVVFAPPEPRTILVIVLPLVALALSTLGQVRVTVGPRGVTVACGWLGWPRLRVPIEDVAEVVVEDVAPMSYGGWGIRTVPGATAVVVRRGEGLRIERHGRRTFVVTVDDAARAAGVLLAHRDAHRATAGGGGHRDG